MTGVVSVSGLLCGVLNSSALKLPFHAASTLWEEVSSRRLELTSAMCRIALVANYWQCYWSQSLAH